MFESMSLGAVASTCKTGIDTMKRKEDGTCVFVGLWESDLLWYLFA